MDYDYNEYLKGFNTKEDIFNFSVSTMYFKRDRFLMENLSHKDRKRNRKRKTYHEFLEFVDKNEISDKEDNHLNSLNSKEWFLRINSVFPSSNFIIKVIDMKEKEQIRRKISEKFNGNILMEHFPELQGKELGKWIGLFRQSYLNWDTFVLTHTTEEILEEFKQFYFEK